MTRSLTQDEKIEADIRARNRRKAAWAKLNEVTENVDPGAGWWTIVGMTNQQDIYDAWDSVLDDHGTLWNNEAGEPIIWVGQPYHLDRINVEDIVARSRKHKLHFRIEAMESWHFPGKTIAIIWERASNSCP